MLDPKFDLNVFKKVRDDLVEQLTFKKECQGAEGCSCCFNSSWRTEVAELERSIQQLNEQIELVETLHRNYLSLFKNTRNIA